MRSLYPIIILVFITIIGNLGRANPRDDEISISPYIEILSSDWSNKGIDEVSKAQHWVTANTNEGKLLAKYEGNWYRLKIDTWVSTEDWLLIHPLSSDFVLYRSKGNSFESSRHGYNFSNENKISYRKTAVLLSDLKNQEILFFKIQGMSSRSSNHPLLIRPEKFVSIISNEVPFSAFYYSFIMVIALISLFAFYMLREKIYFFYSLYLFTTIGIFLGIQGYAYQFWSRWKPGYSMFFFGMVSLFILLFIRELFNLRSNASKSIFYFLSGISLVFSLIAISGQIEMAYNTLYTVQLLTQTIVAFLNGYHAIRSPKDRWVLFGISLSFFVSSLGLLNDRIYIPFSDLIDSAYQPVALLEALLFAFALLKRFYHINTEKREALELARQRDLQQLKLEAEKERMSIQAKLGENAAQIAHDIRSPLSALSLVLRATSELPEDKRIIIRNAVNRINDIANSLLAKNKKEVTFKGSTTEESESTPVLLAPLIDSVVSEKRIQFREKQSVCIEADVHKGYGLFALIVPSELQRVLSNLITNSVEALLDNNGKVSVSLFSIGERISITIQDNGHGFPKESLTRIGEFGLTHGKTGTSSGSGLGLFHAKKIIEAAGGQINIDSCEGNGTTITLNIQNAKPPSWFVSKMILNPMMTIVSLDDDISIHQLWKERFLKQGFGEKCIKLLTFTSGAEFKYWALNKSAQQNILYLIDYELLNQSVSGLDLIEQLAIARNSILVTSRFDESQIQTRADKIGLKLIPKSLAGLVPIVIKETKTSVDAILIDDDLEFINRPIETNSTPIRISEEKVRYDLCLIDDDQELIGVVWSTIAAEKGLKIRLFATPQAFMAEADRIDRQTPIYVDVSLGNGVSGLDVAHDVHKMGFAEINLATGYQADSMVVPPFICRVVGKEPPF